MIFITVGSQKFQFDRLLSAVDNLVTTGEINEEVFAQSGACKYVPNNFPSQPFLNRDEFRETMKRCDIVITHGGTGAIIGAIKAGKKVIAVPRLAKYGEHVDDHQIQLIDEFTKSNFICSCVELAELAKVIAECRNRDFTTYSSNTNKYLAEISDFIERNLK